MHPVEITVQAAGTPDELVGNIRSALSRGLPELQTVPFTHDGTFVCVASGWSMPDYVDEIRVHKACGRPIVAVKAAHDFLTGQGIIPDLWVNLDPRDRRDGIQKPNDYTMYLVASRCPPVIFDHLAGRNVVLWHSWSQGPEHDSLPPGKIAIGGGTTSGLRAINIGYTLGFRKFVLYGYDSCNRADGVKRFTGAMTGPTIDIHVGHTGKKFICNMAMAQQATEFQKLFAVMADLDLDIKGPGLLAAIMEARKHLAAEAA
jgi:hypothetical protein